MRKKVCKFELGDLLPIGLVLVTAGIGIAYGLNVMGEMRTDFRDETISELGTTRDCNVSSGAVTGCGAEYNASSKAIEGVAKIPAKLPLIVTVIVASVVIGILIRYLVVRAQ